MRELAPTDAAYIAGLIDGEGSLILYLHRRTVTPRVTVGMTDRPLLEWLESTTECGTISCQLPRDPLKHKIAYQWKPGIKDLGYFLEQLRPYLRLKAPQADILIEFLQRKGESPTREWQEEQRLRMVALNRNGPD